ncbi:hypothetical protein [Bradyrhizobium betae]|uniref:hypothetical protein n=1 Tax=Bradyrhizobium betae TaxID=244734 RepID=UPI00100E448E|nr:hypothetical protein [Bradyrhizobium betae]
MLQLHLPPTSPFCDTADFLVFDNFPGTPSILNGKPPVIGSGTWSVAGNPDRSLSGNGYLYFGPGGGLDTAYAQMALSEIPGEIGCTFQYDSVAPTPTLSCYPALGGFSQNNFHFQVGPTQFGFTFWKNGVASNIPAWNISNLYLLSPNEIYTYRVFIDPPRAQGFLFDSAGTLVGYSSIDEPNMAAVIGPFMFVQLFDNSLKYGSVWARKKAVNPDLTNASLMRPGALHVGGGLPSGVLSARYDGFTEDQAPAIAATTHDAELGIKAETPGYGARLILSASLTPLAMTGATVLKGGSGYQLNDLLAVVGGTVHSGGAPAQLRVARVGAAGDVTAVSVTVPGLYDSPPPVADDNVTPITGAGAHASVVPTFIGKTPFSSSIELSALLEVIFKDTDGHPWLTKPQFNGNPESSYPTVPGGVRIGGATGPFWVSGTGAPEGHVVAPVGSLFSRTDGGAGSTLYVKESGAGAAGWTPK